MKSLGQQYLMKLPGNSTADKLADTPFRKTKDPLEGRLPRIGFSGFPGKLSISQFNY